ncbi:MAG: DNA polymerase III subunit epsilon [Bacteroidetes bacterium HGW-Bacteroidetes-16]|jgi:DNA polymerase-3 subunit epsilon|nr:MAG: DNA polymerase III subunit epsilon [Bacteroidetes bacterium HGW-Bacteroidetes-16]
MSQYAIVDIETTGLSPSTEKITEIAILIHDGTKVTETFSTLINPEMKIPYRITQMTGINNRMVEDAPKFYEVAKKIVEITEDRIIVGHNVRFDYSFIRNEYKSLGYEYQRQTLDTIKLCRKLIPGQPSYGLGNLCKSLKIENHARHRAEGDAMATTRLFELLLSIEGEPEKTNLTGMQSSLGKSLIENLPKEPGVYYFYNKDNELIYVGKSINIHDRILSHLNNNMNKKAVEMRNAIADVQFTLTGNELVALLLESSEIKKHQPLYNRAQRRTFYNQGLYSFFDDEGYLNLKITRVIASLNPLYTYSSVNEGRNHVEMLMEEYGLCQKLCGLYDTQGPCFHYQIHQCKGACIGEEIKESYNLRVQQALDNYHFEHQNFLLITAGRHPHEKAIVKVENGRYRGFGYVDETNDLNNQDLLHECITSYSDNKEVRRIIKSHLRNNQDGQLLLF